MDPTAFDTLARAIAQTGTRRGVLRRLVASLPLLGLLAAGGPEEARAGEHPDERLGRRTQQRNRHQRNRKRRNKNQNQNNKNYNGNNKHHQHHQHDNNHNNNGGGGGGGNPGPCTATGQDCQRNSDCCSNNCFGQVCAAKVSTCSGQTCSPAGTGCCAGDGCCQPPNNQCNTTGGQQGLCCAPNCQGRECGDDGCGNTGTCGSCKNGQTCSTNGQCQGQPTCSPATCANGCCDKNGNCQPGNTEQACGTGGQACVNCPGAGSSCQNGQCIAAPCGPQTCPHGCCDESGTCQPGNNASLCGTGGVACITCQPAQICTKQGQCQDEFSCDSENCDGCCDPAPFVTGAVCRAGTSKAQCGQNGNSCAACQGSAVCQNGQCLTCTAGNCPNGCCDAQGRCHPGQGSCQGPGGSCCAGCCDGQACRPGTANGACGANAEVCVSCLTDEGPGDCVDGRCVCDADSCPFGCCEHGPGQPGQCLTDDPRFCGAVGGVQCLICPAGTSCNAQGQCVCSPSCPRCQTCNAVTGQCQPVVCPPPADQCHAAGTCDPGTGECSDPTVANGTPCIDSNPLCINGQCCTAGHEVVNGGCFQITQITNGVCTGCSDACQTCGGSIDGSPNFLCANKTTNGCQGNAQCPEGQACQTQIDTCLAPC